MTPLELKFENLILRIDDAVFQAESDKLVNFEGLNRDIHDACLEAQNAEPEAAKAVKPLMGKLISRLDDLTRAISDYQTRLMEKKAQ